MRLLLTLFTILSMQIFSHAQETPNRFYEGVEAYQKGEFQQANEIFSQLYEQHPQSPKLMFNLGLSSYKLGQKGFALGLWRKARFISSGSQTIDGAIAFAEKELGLQSQQDTFFVTFFVWVRKLPNSFWLFTTLLLTFAMGWKIITLFAKRKTPMGDWPISIFLSIPLWIFLFSISLWLILGEMKPVATIVEANVPTRTGPTPSAPTLTSIEEGLLVTILKTHKEWVQIQPPTGSPGWVLKSQIIAIKD